MSEMLCPRDQKLLRVITKSSYYCDYCGGTLIDVNKSATKGLKKIPQLAERVESGKLASPQSAQPIKAFFLKGVEIDYCAQSGFVWLDKGELSQLRGLINKPGHNKAYKESGGISVVGDIVVSVTEAVVENVIIDSAGAIFSVIVSAIDI